MPLHAGSKWVSIFGVALALSKTMAAGSIQPNFWRLEDLENRIVRPGSTMPAGFFLFFFVFLISSRYFKARSLCCCARRSGNFSILAGCIINSDSNVPPSCLSVAFDFDSAPFETCRKTGAGADTSFSFMS